MEKLNCRSDKFTIVLNDSGADVFKNSAFIKTKIMCCDFLSVIFIAVIKHDKDVDEETNHVKTTHYHLVLQLDRIYRIGSMIKLLCDIFHCNENQISIDKCSSLVMQTRYLVHLDDFDKYQYRIDDIESNNFDLIGKYMYYVRSITDVESLITLVKQYKNLLELMSVIGYDNYKKYRIVISDIRRELKYSL